jgi:hypothetical protein
MAVTLNFVQHTSQIKYAHKYSLSCNWELLLCFTLTLCNLLAYHCHFISSCSSITYMLLAGIWKNLTCYVVWYFLRRWSMCPSNFLPLSSYKLWSYGYTLPIGTVKHFSVIVLIFDILYIFFQNIKFYSLSYFEVFTCYMVLLYRTCRIYFIGTCIYSYIKVLRKLTCSQCSVYILKCTVTALAHIKAVDCFPYMKTMLPHYSNFYYW